MPRPSRALRVAGALFGSLLHFAAADTPQSWDCTLKQLTLETAQVVQPFRPTETFQEVADALNGSPQFGAYNCNVSAASVPTSYLPDLATQLLHDAVAAGSPVFYIDASSQGSDSNPGTQTQPFQTIQHGVDACRSATGGQGTGCTLFLRSTQPFYLPAPIVLSAPQDNNLAIASFPGEQATVSGGFALPSLTWSPVDTTGGRNIWSCPLSSSLLRARAAAVGRAAYPGKEGEEDDMLFGVPLSSSLTLLPGLRYGGQRLVRARYPNANPETNGFGSGLTPDWIAPPPLPSQPSTTWNPALPFRNDTVNTVAQTYSLGYNITPGLQANLYFPPAGYFVGQHTTFGGLNGFPQWPSGMNVTHNMFPNLPYTTDVAGNAVVHAFRANHWFSRMHMVSSYTPAANLSNASAPHTITFGWGGFQGAEGTTGDAETFIENVFEELDAPGEWFYNASSSTLYMWWNATSGTIPPSDGFVGTSQKVFFNLTATQSQPIVGVQFANITFREQAVTYFEPHGLPSGGDWSIQRTGLLFFEGVENVAVVGCTFVRNDGIGIFLSGYTRFVNISYNEFAWQGESAIALWGYGDGAPVPGMGPDLTAGNQPRYTTIAYNVARELGIWQKQSSFVFQAVAGFSNTVSNIFFNGPRAGTNYNDGSIGGSVLRGGVAFNFCRESGDHGVHNSWDRIPYLDNRADDGWEEMLRDMPAAEGRAAMLAARAAAERPEEEEEEEEDGAAAAAPPNTTKAYDQITGNLYIANYQCMAAIDNDDVSGYYNSTFNVFAYSPFGLKSDFGGHDNHHSNNVYTRLQLTSWFDGPAAIWNTWGAQNVGNELVFVNNHVVQDWCQNGPWPGFDYTCNSNFTIGITCAPQAGAVVLANNTYYLPLSNGQGPSDVIECGMPLPEYQASCPTCDPGSVALPFPSDADLLALCKQVLGYSAA